MNLQFAILLLGNLISLLIFITCPSTSWMRKSPSLFLHPNGTMKDATCPNVRKMTNSYDVIMVLDLHLD